MTTIERNQRLLEALRIDWVKMLSDEQSKDLQIVVGPAEEGVVSAHRLVLLARCEKLQKRLRRAGNSTLRFPELDLQATKAVIRYLYTSKIELKEITELCRLLPVCHSLGLPGLHSYLLERARAQLTPSAVTHLLAAAITRADESEEQALRDDLQEVVELCMEFIVTHKATVLRSDAFLTSDRNVVARIASSPQFQTCSGEVWSAIMRWSKVKAGVSALQSDWLDEEWDMVREEVIEVLREMGVVKDNIKLTRELLFSADKMQELLERHQELNAEENDSGRDEIFCSSTLLAGREDLQTQIQEWTGHAGKQWQLLFRATSDGFSGRSFHHLCDNRGPTVVVVKTPAGHLFGGYTDIAWNSHYRRGKFSSSNRAFLFSLTSPSSNSPPAKFDIHQPAYAINNHPGNGPIFGSGADLFISSNCERCEESYSMLTCSYGNPKAHPQSLAGTKYFIVEDYEVFGLSV